MDESAKLRNKIDDLEKEINDLEKEINDLEKEIDYLNSKLNEYEFIDYQIADMLEDIKITSQLDKLNFIELIEIFNELRSSNVSIKDIKSLIQSKKDARNKVISP